MEKQALYFPYMRVPQDAWFTRILLYWDAVGTILPTSVLDERSLLGDYTAELIDAELVRPVHPDYYANLIPRFEDNFLALLDGEESIQNRRRLALDTQDVKRIHVEKMGLELCNGLSDRELARPIGEAGSGTWWDVESRTADMFMAYLAVMLGALEELKMDPVTDDTDLFVRTPDTAVARADALRLGVLEAVLPAPDEQVGVVELAAFKDQHGAQLAAFRTTIEEELLGIALIDDEEARKRQKELTEARLRWEVEEIAASMQARQWPKIIFGTVCGVAAVGGTAAAAVATGGAAVALAAPGLIGSAYAAIKAFPRREVPHSPLVYAALSRSRLVG